MRLGELFLRELRFRPLGFLIGLVAVTAAVSSVVGSRAFLAGHDTETARLVEELEQRSARRMAALREEARVFTKSLGFNILLLPAGQDPAELYTQDRSRHFFAQDRVLKLAQARLATLNHLLPMLRQRVPWEDSELVVVGIEGEIYIKAPGFQKPIAEAVGPGTVHLGAVLHRRLARKVGETFPLLGERFEVARLLPEKGNADDVTVLMNLGDAQRLLDRRGLVSGVLALSCTCAAGDLGLIREEVEPLLPRVQVIEFRDRARARLRARAAVDRTARAEVEDITSSRATLREQVASMALLLGALLTAGTVLLLAALTAVNARDRRLEVAILRALGLGPGRVLVLFLLKAAVSGLAGGLLGCAAGLGAGRALAGEGATTSPLFLGLALAGAVAVAMSASAVPALLAARRDPAVVLNRG